VTAAALLPLAREATAAAAEMIRTRLPGVITAKGDRDMASEVDFAVERAVRDLLRERTPGIRFLGEEQGACAGGGSPGGGLPAPGGELTWVLDPVDGTANFVRGLPLCAVSLGLVRDRRPVLGVIEMPFLGGRYHAVEGGGAYVDGRPIRASGIGTLAGAMVALGDYAVGPDAARANRERLALTNLLVPRVQRVRMLGTAAIDLAWLAQGRLDALVMLANNPWDTAAGVVLAREAGVRVVDRHGVEHTMASGETLAGSPAVLDEILALIRTVDAERRSEPEGNVPE
jgi:myo-inositol-1(or 4)-monophosphatase